MCNDVARSGKVVVDIPMQTASKVLVLGGCTW
jgi:hypothetical protein